MKKVVLTLGLIGGISCCLVMLAPNLTHADNELQSSSNSGQSRLTVSRTASVKIPTVKKYSGQSGQLESISGTQNQTVLRNRQSLKKYAKTTWLVNAYTTVTSANGKTVRYYAVKNVKDGVQGWIAADQLQDGRNYQADQLRNKSGRNYIRARKGKIYQSSGPLSAWHLVKGKMLDTKRTYYATKQRYYYKYGKKYLYFYVQSDQGMSGWVWHRYLKSGTGQVIHSQQNKIKQHLRKYLKTVTKDKTAAVAFYNLSPKKGSAAAKRQNVSVYQAGNLAVNVRGNQVTTSASTYKLYIAAYLLHLKQLGRFSWNRANTSGMTSMIVHSANEYPVSILNRYGDAPINHWLGTQGYYGNVFDMNRNAQTTANSLIKALRDLQNGKKAFQNQHDRARLLGLMRRQVFRRGIPAGAAKAYPGTKVQDKVGFLADNNGDAGIITLPNGQRYLLVVFTWGHHQSGFSGFPRIAKITAQIQKIVY